MTFSIDEARRRSGEWVFEIKGIEGKGIYGTLLTNCGGGLYLLDSEFVQLPMTLRKILPPEQFQVPPDAAPEEATRRRSATVGLWAGSGPAQPPTSRNDIRLTRSRPLTNHETPHPL